MAQAKWRTRWALTSLDEKSTFSTCRSVRTTLEEFKTATITRHFPFVFELPWDKGILWLSQHHRFRKVSFSKCFLSILKCKAADSKFLLFEERFRKAQFSWRIVVWTVDLAGDIKLRFQLPPAHVDVALHERTECNERLTKREARKCCGNTWMRLVFPQFYTMFLPNLHSRFFNPTLQRKGLLLL